MPTLACKDIEISDCDFVARGETIHDVVEQMVDHIEDRHAEAWGHAERDMDIRAERDFLAKHIKDEESSPI
jgi:predicted small metal-binding protein